ncbi:glucokinase, partial [Zobellella denitrificans]|uniref:glucokinase n=1 Tax=Zobellella denitrificans TaxID=347534 RepID=UPI0015953F39
MDAAEGAQIQRQVAAEASHQLAEQGQGSPAQRAVAAEGALCRRTLARFCGLMGRFGRNLAQNLGTFGGAYIAGGIVPGFLSFFRASGFRAACEDSGRLWDA